MDKDKYYTYQKIYDLLYETLGLMSNNQIKDEELNFENQNKNKKKKILQLSVDCYCNRMKNEHNLNMENIKKLQRYINFNLLLKTVISDHIEYDNDGNIIHINGINVTENNIELSYYEPEKCQYERLIEQEFMSDNWTKYI